MIYKIELKISGRTAYTLFTEDISPERLKEKEAEAMKLLSSNRFTKNLPLEVVSTPQARRP